MDLITVFLPTTWRGVEVLSPYQLNLVENGDLIDVYFWKPSIEENGKHFMRLPKKSKKAFIAACAGEEV
tara:strand:- start:380 stop:586 length:207 start_codon:yes stop_codon:yes gene_type:complete